MKTLSREEFIRKSKEMFGDDAFDYSRMNYINGYTPVELVCKKHGSLMIEPTRHLKIKGGCPKCSPSIRNRRTAMTNEQFKELCRKMHGDKYNLDKVQYKSMKEKVTADCPIHGEFSIMAYDFSHLRGCPSCGRSTVERAGKTFGTVKRITSNEDFIKKARGVHGDKYDYSKTDVNHRDEKSRVCIICPKHGEFWQIPSHHLKGRGCVKCGKEQGGKTAMLTTESFIAKAMTVHGDKYNYDKVNYKGCNGKVTITCPIHGDFEQTAYSHLEGHGCPKCMCEKNSMSILSNTDDFLVKARMVHSGENNDYSKVKYVDAKTPVEIICGHGHTYWQTPNKHLNGHGCPYCSHIVSKFETEIRDFLSESIKDEILTSKRSIIGDSLELDIYVPSRKIAIECDGLYWHDEMHHPDKKYHLDKTKRCESKGIRLIHIFEDEWSCHKEIVKSMLLNIFGCNHDEIYARRCDIAEVDGAEAKKFLDENHIQGAITSSINIGLRLNGELLSIMSFGHPRKVLGKRDDDRKHYELLRFCNKLNTKVVGGASKILKYFIEKYSPTRIETFADKRWSLGRLYETLGFEYTHTSEPNYYYIIDNERHNRFGFRKDVLVKEGYDPSKSEHEIMLERGIYRIYDCGNLHFVMNL